MTSNRWQVQVERCMDTGTWHGVVRTSSSCMIAAASRHRSANSSIHCPSATFSPCMQSAVSVLSVFNLLFATCLGTWVGGDLVTFWETVPLHGPVFLRVIRSTSLLSSAECIDCGRACSCRASLLHICAKHSNTSTTSRCVEPENPAKQTVTPATAQRSAGSSSLTFEKLNDSPATSAAADTAAHASRQRAKNACVTCGGDVANAGDDSFSRTSTRGARL
jgi:hypothetical protein